MKLAQHTSDRQQGQLQVDAANDHMEGGNVTQFKHKQPGKLSDERSAKPVAQRAKRAPKAAASKIASMTRDDLSFTARIPRKEFPDLPMLENWAPLVVPRQINQWDIGVELGHKMVDEVEKLASLNEEGAYNAIRFAFSSQNWQPGRGTEMGFSEGIAKLAMVGLRHLADGGKPYDPANPKTAQTELTSSSSVKKQVAKRPVRAKRRGLRAHSCKSTPWARLPFVGKDHGKHETNWDVPMTGTFLGGVEAGKSIAHIYLKYLRDERGNQFSLSSSLLGSMLYSMALKQPATKEEQTALNGQRAGFLGELSRWLEQAAVRLGPDLDRLSEQQLIDNTNVWLDPDAYSQEFRDLG